MVVKKKLKKNINSLDNSYQSDKFRLAYLPSLCESMLKCGGFFFGRRFNAL